MLKLKNIKISVKLWMIIIPAIIALVGLLYYFNYRSNAIYNDLETLLYEEVYQNASEILNADRDFYQAAIAEQEIYLSDAIGDARQALLDSVDENAQQVQDRISGALESLRGNTVLYTEFRHSSSQSTLEELYADFQANYDAWQSSYDVETRSGDLTAHNAYFDAAREDINIMTELLDEYANSQSASITNTIQQSIRFTVILVSALIILILIFSVVIIRYFNGSIKYITKVNQQIADGELSIQVEEKRMSKDEIGRLCYATGQILNQLNAYVAYIDEITHEITKMASGDMRVQLEQDYTGQFKPVKDAMEEFAASTDTIMKQIRSVAELVKDGASSISAGAQHLSQGATEQASTVEELTASLEQISSQTNLNAQNAETADKLSTATRANASIGNEQMKEMLAAMESINASSANINKIIKVIEDIAFQTNILALNAAVEAARAGQYGKGFAVVAEEVRTLAGRSSKAASETTELIEDSIRKIDGGTKLAKETAEALSKIVVEVEDVANLVGSIAVASKEQALGIDQINQGIVEVSQVIQTNAATSEENAATSEDLSQQADLLYNHVAHFKLRDN